MFKELCGYMKVPSLKSCFHLLLTVLQGIFQSRNCLIFLPMMRNLIFGTSPAAVCGLSGEQLSSWPPLCSLCSQVIPAFLILLQAKQ